MKSLFAELKRRNVFKVGIAYIIVGWVVLQFIDVSAQILELPKWFGKAIFILVIAGFPISLLLAWAYEITPQGLKKTKEVDKKKSITPKTGQKLNYVIMAGLVLALGYFVWERFAAAPPDQAGGPREASIAVLPFADLSPGADQGYFADGISEEILNVLAQIPSIKVAGRTSSFQFKGKNEDLRVIGDQLGVANVLEGSVRKEANRVRITVQLISAKDGFHIWSQTYDRELNDIFTIQDQISKSVADALQVELGLVEGKKAETSNLEAYSLYLRARQFLHARGTDNLEKAAKLFEAVVILDPNFSAAWSGMARADSLIPGYSVAAVDSARYFERARQAAETAKTLNPDNAEAFSALNYVQMLTFDWSGAEASNQKAIGLSPNDAEIANFAGDYYRITGDFANSRIWEERAYELDPLHAVNTVDLSQLDWDQDRYDQAI
jgi:TolB-like protein